MRITLIRTDMTAPAIGRKRAKDVMQPLACAILAGLTPGDIEIKFYDDRIEDIPVDERTDAAVISLESHTARRGYELARAFRARGVKVIVGGIHPSAMPEEAGLNADSVAIGEAEGIWPEIIHDLRSGSLKKFYRSNGQPSLEGLRVRRDIFRGKRYLPLVPVEFGRGCCYACDFCSVSSFYRGYRHRPVKDVAGELHGLDRGRIFFIDDNIAASPAAARSLFEALVPLRINWIGQISLERIEDEGFVALAAKSGCRVLLVGLESLNRGNLESMSKSSNLQVGSFEKPLKLLRKYGIKAYATFLFGYDEDTRKSFQETLEYALEQKFFIANFNLLMPYPGTPLYDRMRREGVLLREKWWLDEDYRFGQAVFRPRGMSALELGEGCIRARKEFNSLRNILYRSCESRANCPTPADFFQFMAYNLLIRREVCRKHGLALG